MQTKAIFIDKDDTLIPDIPYNVNPNLITLTVGALTALRRLQDLGYKLVVVSNQSGVAHGLFTEAQLLGVKAKLDRLLAAQDVRLDGFYYCPHHPWGVVSKYAVHCECRKPLPGLLLAAANQLEIDLSQSWMIGDTHADVVAAHRCGCRTIAFTFYRDDQIDEAQYQAVSFADVAEIITDHP